MVARLTLLPGGRRAASVQYYLSPSECWTERAQVVSVSEFRGLCKTTSPEEIVDEILLADDAAHVSTELRQHIRESLASTFGVADSAVNMWIVGSAKLGFSLTERRKDGVVFPRYRPFGPLSDIDTAVVSPEIFRLIWDELSSFAHEQPWMPWNSGPLGDYMVCGWLRPDHFPRRRLRRCDDWWDRFRQLSADLRFSRRKVRGGLFHSLDDLRRYQRRAVVECINLELECA
jgi:hypothetical protein